MGQLTTIRHPQSPPRPRRNPNPNRIITPPANPLLMGHVKILRRGEAPTAFQETEPSAANPPAADTKKNRRRKKKKKKEEEEEEVVGFRDGDDMELYSTSCRLGPEPDMVPTRTALIVEAPPASSLPLPLSLLRRSLV